MAQYGYRERDLIIPAQDLLYRRIPKKTYWDIINKFSYPPEIIPPKIFRSDEEEYSVDWERYAIPQWTQSRKDEFFKERDGIENYRIKNYGVMSLVTGLVRKIPLKVKYTPNNENIAHSDIKIPIEKIDITDMISLFSALALFSILTGFSLLRSSFTECLSSLIFSFFFVGCFFSSSFPILIKFIFYLFKKHIKPLVDTNQLYEGYEFINIRDLQSEVKSFLSSYLHSRFNSNVESNKHIKVFVENLFEEK